MRQPHDRQVDAGGEHERDQPGSEAREADEQLAAADTAATGHTTTSVTSPPIQSDAAERCTQSAISVFHDEPGSTPSWPETERPATKPSDNTSAGTSKRGRSSSQAR